MAVPRPVLLALLGVALCAAAFLATRGSSDPGGSVTAVPAPAPAAPKTSAAKPHTKKHTPPARHAPKPKVAPKHEAAPSKPVTATSAALAAVSGGAAALAQPTASKPTAHKPTTPAPAPKPKVSLASRVKTALADGKAVVFLFTRPGAADDTGTRQSVQTLSGMKRVLVVKAGMKDLTEFRPVLAGANVSQIPSVVIVHKGAPGRLIEGYVDAGTLRQNVADALR
jgi:hypothetical protein